MRWVISSSQIISVCFAVITNPHPHLAACVHPGVGTSPLFIAICLPTAQSGLCEGDLVFLHPLSCRFRKLISVKRKQHLSGTCSA